VARDAPRFAEVLRALLRVDFRLELPALFRPVADEAPRRTCDADDFAEERQPVDFALVAVVRRRELPDFDAAFLTPRTDADLREPPLARKVEALRPRALVARPVLAVRAPRLRVEGPRPAVELPRRAINLLKLLCWPSAVVSCTSNAKPCSSNFSNQSSHSISFSESPPE
jgi:hypothetical protein